MNRYEQIPHTADIAIRVIGGDLGELFSNAAFGMFDIIADLEGMTRRISVDFSLEAASCEELLVTWLDELLYSFYTKGIIFCEFDIIDIADTRLKARAHGRLLADNKNRLKREVKAVTYHGLEVKDSGSGYSVDIIFDV